MNMTWFWQKGWACMAYGRKGLARPISVLAGNKMEDGKEKKNGKYFQLLQLT